MAYIEKINPLGIKPEFVGKIAKPRELYNIRYVTVRAHYTMCVPSPLPCSKKFKVTTGGFSKYGNWVFRTQEIRMEIRYKRAIEK